MSVKRVLSIVLAASALLLAVGIGPRFNGSTHALPPVQAGMTVPYTGSLTDQAGQPVADGAYDFAFALYATGAGGEAVWTEAQESVVVQGGAFTTLLGSAALLPKEALDGGARWLEVAVRGPGEAEFTLLSPRQELSAASVAPSDLTAPANGLSCAHTHLGEVWDANIGWSNAGLRINNSANGPALWGYNSGGGNGVRGESPTNIGVYGSSDSNYGVFGRSETGYAGGFAGGNEHNDLLLGGAVGRINANEEADSELYLSSNADVIVKLDNDSGGDNVFRVWSSGGADLCTISEVGGLVCAAGKSAVVETADYGWRRLYTVESPEVWFEELGTASLVDGKATVTFEPIFAETVNLEEDYHVFVTPLCQEPVLLFVTAKTGVGFTVQGVTLDNQPSSCDFDYRVAAKRLGYEDVRLEKTAWQEGE